jgi:hypothetical protein
MRSPRLTSSVMSRRAWKEPNHLLRPRMRMATSLSAAG